ncbi:MAG TPA: hypothetical protein VEO02_10020 [Thermoanaerobaculia bacterium]|nr:hypothetical protein [Thermoanaerobaculia bacterium]
MRLSSRLVSLAITVAVAGLAGCQKSEAPAGGGTSTASAKQEPTPDAHPPFGILNTPEEGATVESKSWGTGWALDDSGILQATAIAENGAASPAKIGQAFPGVKEAYPNMRDNDTAGFIFGIPDLPPGPHTLKIEIIAKDGGKVVLTRNFNMK